MKRIAIGAVTGLAVWFGSALAAEAQQITPTGPMAVSVTDTQEVYTATITTNRSGWFYLQVYNNGVQVYGGQWFISTSGPSYNFQSPVLSTASWGLAIGNSIDFKGTFVIAGTTQHVCQDYYLTVQSGGTTMIPSSKSDVMLVRAVPNRKEELGEVFALDDRRDA